MSLFCIMKSLSSRSFVFMLLPYVKSFFESSSSEHCSKSGIDSYPSWSMDASHPNTRTVYSPMLKVICNIKKN
ncbi:hypothetical protein FKM82_013353 [Ascaphus truei]